MTDEETKTLKRKATILLTDGSRLVVDRVTPGEDGRIRVWAHATLTRGMFPILPEDISSVLPEDDRG